MSSRSPKFLPLKTKKESKGSQTPTANLSTRKLKSKRKLRLNSPGKSADLIQSSLSQKAGKSGLQSPTKTSPVRPAKHKKADKSTAAEGAGLRKQSLKSDPRTRRESSGTQTANDPVEEQKSIPDYVELYLKEKEKAAAFYKAYRKIKDCSQDQELKAQEELESLREHLDQQKSATQRLLALAGENNATWAGTLSNSLGQLEVKLSGLEQGCSKVPQLLRQARKSHKEKAALKSLVRQLEAQLARGLDRDSSEKEMLRLQAEAEKKQANFVIDTLRSKLSKAESSLEILQGEFEKENRKHTEDRISIARGVQVQKEHQQSILSLTEKLARAEQELQQQQAKSRSLKQEMRNLQRETASTVDCLNETTAQKSSEGNTLRPTIAELSPVRRSGNLSEALASKERIVGDLQVECANLHSQLTRAHGETAKLKEMLERAREEQARMAQSDQAAIQRLEESHIGLTEQVEHLKFQHKQLKIENERLEQEKLDQTRRGALSPRGQLSRGETDKLRKQLDEKTNRTYELETILGEVKARLFIENEQKDKLIEGLMQEVELLKQTHKGSKQRTLI